jgi:uncharacterized protein YrrD
MLKKYREVVGLPVLCAQEGKILGVVEDIIISFQNREVKGFELKKRGYDIASRGFLFKDVENFGKDALIIKKSSCIDSLKNLDINISFNKARIPNKKVICGRRVYTNTGRELGVVEDILFDPTTGRLEGIEVSDGILEDIIQGRNILPLFGKVEFGEDNIMVGREAVEEMMSTGGGIIKRLMKTEVKGETK